MTDDIELLRRFATGGEEDAFRELINRHVDFVYSAALRQVNGEAPLAEDVAQMVFIDLARKARSLPTDLVLTGWLYEAVRFAAANSIRGERRRRTREQEALAMQNLAPESTPDWEQLCPVLDAAMGELSASDRDAILLRYFKNQDFRAVGLALGVSDDAAQKRVSRAVDHLREFLAKRGVIIGTQGLVVVIAANAIQAAPAGLSGAIAAAALAGTTILTTATLTVGKAIAMTTMQKSLITAALAVALGASVYETVQAITARTETQALKQQQTLLTEQLARITGERDEAYRRLAALPEDPKRLGAITAELLKLRGEVNRLRGEALSNQADPTQTKAQAWLERVNQLKQYVEQHPEAKIPELRFVTEDDWLRVTMTGFETDARGITDESYRRSLVSLRNLGKNKFAGMASQALMGYEFSHDHHFPTHVLQLKPHFSEPIEDALLQRYGIFPSTTFPGSRASGNWVIAEITSPDEDLNYRYIIHENGSSSARFNEATSKEDIAQLNAQMRLLAETLVPVATAYAAAHAGNPPPTPEQLVTFATTPEQQAALQKLIELRKDSETFVSPTRSLSHVNRK